MDTMNCLILEPALFIGDVEEYMKDKDFEETYKSLEYSLKTYTKFYNDCRDYFRKLSSKSINMEKNIQAVDFIKRSEMFKTYSMINRTLFVEVEIPITKTVFLPIGSETFLEFDIDEALNFLEKKSDDLRKMKDTIINNSMIVSEQITITEVSMAQLRDYITE